MSHRARQWHPLASFVRRTVQFSFRYQPHHLRNRRGRQPQVNVRAICARFVDIHAHHAVAKGVNARHRDSSHHSQSQLGQKNHREPPSDPFVFFESIHTRTVLSSSFTETSSWSPCAESIFSPATRSISSLPAEKSASTTDSGIFTSTCVSFVSLLSEVPLLTTASLFFASASLPSWWCMCTWCLPLVSVTCTSMYPFCLATRTSPSLEFTVTNSPSLDVRTASIRARTSTPSAFNLSMVTFPPCS